mgnify:CR=1 FL=1
MTQYVIKLASEKADSQFVAGFPSTGLVFTNHPDEHAHRFDSMTAALVQALSCGLELEAITIEPIAEHRLDSLKGWGSASG